MCVCNTGTKEVGNIRGADMYLLEAGVGFSSSPDDDPIRCTCGFSAIMNRRLSHRAGLFYEDEVEITGPNFIDDAVDRRKTSLLIVSASAGKKRCKELETAESVNMKDTNNINTNSTSVDILPQAVLELLREQCVFIRSSANALCRSASKAISASENQKWTLNILEFTDGNEVTSLALEQGRQAATADGLPSCKLAGDETRRGISAGLHRWQFLRADGPHCNQDIVRVMRHLQPLLQEAVQKKCTTRLWDAPYTVNGPLTWRQFHRLAGRGELIQFSPGLENFWPAGQIWPAA
jgi:mediator of RNA polymerase II transcription subunit 13